MAKILIVDDRSINRQFLVALLGYAGHTLFEAADGADALEVVKREHPDLIILDLYMPVMDGNEVAEKIKSDPDLARTPIIFYTAAYNQREARALGGSCGVTEFITKPSEPAFILERVNAVLSQAQAPTAAALFNGNIPAELIALQTSSVRLTALIELGMELASDHDSHEQLQRLCLAARHIIGAKYAVLGILDGTNDSLRDFVLSGDGFKRAPMPTFERPKEGILGRILDGRRPVRVRPEHETEPTIRRIISGRDTVTSFLGVPVYTPTKVYGWLCLVNKVGGNEFTVEDERLAITLASQAAVAYENTSLLDENRTNAEELDRTRREQMTLKDQFLSHISHELRTPLANIYQFVTILLDGLGGELTAEQSELLGVVLANSEQLKTMIADLLDATRSESGKLHLECKSMPPAEILTSSVRNFLPRAADKNISLTVDIGVNVPDVYADPARVRQVVHNLIDNAVKFTPSGGTVCAYVRTTDKDPRFVYLSVSDSGCGIDPTSLENVFDRLYQVESSDDSGRKGLGLGLHICRQLVDQQGGRIWADSTPGKGSVFTFTLPVAGTQTV